MSKTTKLRALVTLRKSAAGRTADQVKTAILDYYKSLLDQTSLDESKKQTALLLFEGGLNIAVAVLLKEKNTSDSVGSLTLAICDMLAKDRIMMINGRIYFFDSKDIECLAAIIAMVIQSMSVVNEATNAKLYAAAGGPFGAAAGVYIVAVAIYQYSQSVIGVSQKCDTTFEKVKTILNDIERKEYPSDLDATLFENVARSNIAAISIASGHQPSGNAFSSQLPTPPDYLDQSSRRLATA